MSSTPAELTPSQILRLLSTHRKRWLVPTVVCAVLAAGFALVMPRYWEASQAVLVRQEVRSKTDRPGKFADLYEMRTLQETILELARSRQVVAATLNTVAQAKSGQSPSEPTSEQIEKFRHRLQMLPPGGAEFGKTEVFYLTVKDTDRQRAIRLVGALGHQLDRRLSQLRNQQAQSLIRDFEKQVDLANESHQQLTAELVAFESKIGPDLGELRMLHAASSGQSDLRQQAVNLETDRRRFETRVLESEQLLKVLAVSQKDPNQLVSLPSSLLNSQPTLRSLKDGLIAAQLNTARLRGTRTAKHPLVTGAIDSESRMRHNLHAELQTAIDGLKVELNLDRHRLANVQAHVKDVRDRLGLLANQRGKYSNHVAAVENSRQVLDQTRRNLSEARATQAAANSGSLVTMIDQPETGPYPAGMGRAMVLLVGTFGGLVFGLGLVFWTVNPAPPTSESAQADVASNANTNTNVEAVLVPSAPWIQPRSVAEFTEPVPVSVTPVSTLNTLFSDVSQNGVQQHSQS